MYCGANTSYVHVFQFSQLYRELKLSSLLLLEAMNNKFALKTLKLTPTCFGFD